MNKNRHHIENMSIFILQLLKLLKCHLCSLKNAIGTAGWTDGIFWHWWHFKVWIWFKCHILICSLLPYKYVCVIYHIWMLFCHFASKSTNEKDDPGFETQGKGHSKSKIGANSGSTKWTLVQQKFDGGVGWVIFGWKF